MRLINLAMLAVAGVGLSTGPLQAQTMARPLIVEGTTSRTGTSGEVGTDFALLRGPEGSVLRSVTFSEDGDIPCQVAATFWNTLPEGTSGTTAVTGGRRGGQASPRFRAVTNSDSWKSASCYNPSGRQEVIIPGASGPADAPRPPRAFDQVRVCVNGSNGRLKGATFRGAFIDVNGSTHDPGLVSTFDRPNCNEQKTRQRCPEGEVAVALRLEIRDLGSKSGVVGLSLQCAAARLG